MKLDWVTPAKNSIKSNDKIDFLFSIYSREDLKRAGSLGKDLYIGVFNKEPENGPVEFNIQMREIDGFSLLSEDLQKNMDFFEKVHLEADAYDATEDDCTDLFSFMTQPELTQGEVVFHSFIPLLEYTKPKDGEVFYDLGCGLGKPLLIASLAFPKLKACIGIELLEGVASKADEVAKKA